MAATTVVHFPPFALDVANEQLWHGEQQLPLRPKPFAILRYLVERPGQLVTKDELLKAIWPQTYVSEGLLHTYLRDLRHVLNDDPEAPRFIETIVRRGYRFIAPLTKEEDFTHEKGKAVLTESKQPLVSALSVKASSEPFVGRETALTALYEHLRYALAGQRQLVFVTGEPGIGKTTVVDAFLEQVSGRQEIWIGRGQCVGQYGAGEAYLPILEALGRLGRTLAGEQLRIVLRHQAPSWLVQLPALLADGELAVLQRAVQGITRERMLRELTEALEVLTTEHPLVLVLEDLHWSDPSTVDLLTAIAGRREAARLLVLGTYRPADIIVNGHPLKAAKQELDLHERCSELALTFLTSEDIAQYLSMRFPQHHFPAAFGQRLQQHTEGNPLFLVNTVEDLVRRQMVIEREGQWQLRSSSDEIALGVPVSVQQLIGRQFERLSMEEQQLLEVASVAGESFSAAAIAAGLETELEQSETRCESLARREQFLHAQELVTWPDGTIAGHYHFGHALYQQVVYERIGAARRVQLHRRIGQRTELGYGEQAEEIAAELAVHFERGHDYQRAVQYLEQAGKNAVQRSAHREAITHFTKGVELLKAFPDTPERTQQELTLQLGLGPSLWILQGSGAPQVRATYNRALELCRQLGETPALLPTLLGLRSTYVAQADYRTAHELSERCLRLAQKVQDPALLLQAHLGMGVILVYFGEFAPAREHLEQAFSLYDPQQHNPRVTRTPQDPGVVSLTYLAWTLWLLGYPEQGVKKAPEALALAQDLSHPFSLGWALNLAAKVRLFRREGAIVREQSEAILRLATEKGIPYWTTEGTMMRGWALAEQGQEEEGLAQLRDGFAAWRAMGTNVVAPLFLAWQIEVYGRLGQIEEGQSALTEAFALVDKTGEGFYVAELHRLKGELTLKQSRVRGSKSQTVQSLESTVPSLQKSKSQLRNPNSQREAEVCFLKAIEIAQHQQAKSLELRATTSLARLWQQQSKAKQAHKVLSEVYNWFTEGFDTKDLQEAKALLDELA